MDVYAHVVQFVVIALLVLLVHQVQLVPPVSPVHLDVQLHALNVDYTIVCVVLNVILFHANVALNAQVILVNVVRYANLIHANAAQCV